MKYLRVVLGALLLPLTAAFVWQFFNLVVGLGRTVSDAAVPFWLGLGSYFIFQVVFARPIRTYVFGHELTHALAGIVSGARLKSFKVSARGGSVVLTKTSVWITLAPYFVPLYTVLLIILFKAGGIFWELDTYEPYFLFAAGFSLSFHFGLTCFALAQGQSDLKQFGVFFSGIVITLVSCLVLAMLLKAIFPSEVSLSGYLHRSLESTVVIGRAVYDAAASRIVVESVPGGTHPT